MFWVKFRRARLFYEDLFYFSRELMVRLKCLLTVMTEYSTWLRREELTKLHFLYASKTPAN